MDFEFVVSGIPRTDQTKSPKSRADWKARIAKAAAEAWPGDGNPAADEISAVVVYFYRDATNIDVDNIGKPIFDALTGVAIEDDRIVSQVLLRKTNQTGLIISNPSAALASLLGKADSFIYVKLGPPPRHSEVPA